MTENKDDEEPSPFSALLKTEFRWPKQSDQPFAQAPNWEDNAYLETSASSRLVMMMTSYKKIADLAVGAVLEARRDTSALVYPILFNYRQFIELSLKYLISSYGRAVGIGAMWKTHDLWDLWVTFKDVLDRYGHVVNDADEVVEKAIKDFARVDPKSFSYRYPVDTKGKEIPLAFQELDLRNLADVMQALENYFSGCDGYLDHLKDAGP